MDTRLLLCSALSTLFACAAPEVEPVLSYEEQALLELEQDAAEEAEAAPVSEAPLSDYAESMLDEEPSPKYAMTADELSVWNDPSFKRRFVDSYLAGIDVEPSVTSIEREQLQKIQALISSDKKERAIQLLRKYGTEAASAVFDFTLGSLYFQAEEVVEASKHYFIAVEKYPNFRRAWKNLGICHVRSNGFPDAVEAFARVIELGGGDSVTYGMLGFAYGNIGNHLSAESAYRMATLLDPNTLDWRMQLARSLFQQQRFADASSLCGTLIAEYPERTEFWLLQASAFIGMGKTLKAAENYEFVDSLGGSTVDSLNTLGDIYVNEELFTSAVACYARALEKDANATSKRAIRAAKSLTAQGAFDDTAWLLNQVESLRGDSLDVDSKKEVLRLRARLAMAKGASDEEAKVLEEIVELDPLDGGAFILLAQHSSRSGDPEQAIFYYERAAALEGFEAEAKMRHAQVLVGLSRYAEALPLLRRSQTLDPRDNVQEYLEQVERIAKTR